MIGRNVRWTHFRSELFGNCLAFVGVLFDLWERHRCKKNRDSNNSTANNGKEFFWPISVSRAASTGSGDSAPSQQRTWHQFHVFKSHLFNLFSVFLSYFFLNFNSKSWFRSTSFHFERMHWKRHVWSLTKSSRNCKRRLQRGLFLLSFVQWLSHISTWYFFLVPFAKTSIFCSAFNSHYVLVFCKVYLKLFKKTCVMHL